MPRLTLVGKWGVLVVLLMLAPVNAEEKQPPTNVLTLAQTALEPWNPAGVQVENPAALIDGDSGTIASASVSGDAPLTLIYGFGGDMVAIEELVVTLPAEGDDVQFPKRVDLLVNGVATRRLPLGADGSVISQCRAAEVFATTDRREVDHVAIHHAGRCEQCGDR